MKTTVLLTLASIIVTLAVAFAVPPVLGLDHAVATGLHQYMRDRHGLVVTMQTWTDVFGPWTFRGLLTVLAVCQLWRRRPLLAGWIAVTALLAAAVDSGLKLLLARVRPQWIDPLSHATSGSFPSGHALTSAMGCAVLLALAWPTLGRWGRRAGVIAAVAVPLVTGFTRLGLGVHYLSDVVGGWLIGVTVVIATTVALRAIVARRSPRSEPGHPAA